MDITAILSPLFNALWYLIPLLIVIAILKSPWFKGVLGEMIVNFLIERNLDKGSYHLIKNVTLPTEDGTTQIDHILVSKYGVFVIETKNMKGWIFGSAKQKQWTHRIYKHSMKFQNPVHQNYKHLKTLERCLDIPNDRLFSVIVFIGDSTFKTEMPDNVTHARGCIDYIKSKTGAVLSQQQVQQIIATIESGRLQPSFQTNREHVKHVSRIVQDKSNDRNCPRCGSKMVIREIKKGANIGAKFYGCSMFPKCRSMVKV